jgi:hypothetical protein
MTDEGYQQAQTLFPFFRRKGSLTFISMFENKGFVINRYLRILEKKPLLHYRVDPATYLTRASLAWDVMLLKTQVEIDSITDPESITTIENCERGGFTLCVPRKARDSK